MKIKIELIENFMNKYGISHNKLEKLCNISKRSLQNVFANSPNTTYLTLKRIATLMDMDISDIVED